MLDKFGLGEESQQKTIYELLLAILGRTQTDARSA
jgi:hypothetical protein